MKNQDFVNSSNRIIDQSNIGDCVGSTTSEIGKMWEENADLWHELAERGHDLYRDLVSTPGFFHILPKINGVVGLDVGCGDGHNTRLLAEAGAIMTGIDISPTFIRIAQSNPAQKTAHINYLTADAMSLPFENESFGFVTAFNSLMDMPNYEQVLKETFRVLRIGGFLQFVITHPCFWTPDMQWISDDRDQSPALLCNNYFGLDSGKIHHWLFEGTNPSQTKNRTFRTALYKRTLSDWLNVLARTGFVFEEMLEPQPSQHAVQNNPMIAKSCIIPYFMVIRCRKGSFSAS